MRKEISLKIDMNSSEEEWTNFLEELNEIVNYLEGHGISEALEKYANNQGSAEDVFKLFENDSREQTVRAVEDLDRLLDRVQGTSLQQPENPDQPDGDSA